MSSAAAGKCVVHHHQMDRSQPPQASAIISMLIKGCRVRGVSATSGNTFNQKADCASWVQFQALKEGSFSLDAPSGVAEFEVAGHPCLHPRINCDGEPLFGSLTLLAQSEVQALLGSPSYLETFTNQSICLFIEGLSLSVRLNSLLCHNHFTFRIRLFDLERKKA